MRKSLLVLFSLLTFGLYGQAVQPQGTAVMVDASGNVIWPPAGLNYVPRTTDGQRIYGTAVGGVPYTFPYDKLPNANTIAMRDINGTLKVGNPGTDSLAATPKSYVDARTPQSAWLVCTIQIRTASGDIWTDFEFKIMTQSGGVITLHLYYHSPDPGRSVVSGQIGTVAGVWFTSSSTAGDSRLLRKQSATQSIWQQIGGGSNTTTSVMIAIPVDTVIRPDNAGLFAEYLRFSPTDHERDAAGRSVWRLADLQWRTVLPNP